MRRWTLESGEPPPSGVEVMYRGPRPEATSWPDVRRWDDAARTWTLLPEPPRRTAQPDVVVRVAAAAATFRGFVRTKSGTALAGPAWLSTADLEAWSLRYTVHASASPEPVRVPCGAWLSQPGEPDWGHWLIDLLPQAVSLDEVAPPEVPFLISSDAPAYVESLLALAGTGGRRVRRLAPVGRMVEVDELWVATSARQRDAFAPDRAGVFRRMTNESHPIVDARPEGEQLFLSRAETPLFANKRTLVTREAVENVALARGYSRWIPEAMSIPQQIVAANSARRIMGEGGSGMMNCLFAHSGADEVLLRSRVNPQTLHPLIAGTAGLGLWVIEGRPTRAASDEEPHSVSNWHESWVVEPDTVDRAMEAMS